MKTIAFFNNKGGVGKTSLVYHLVCMFGVQGRRVIAADLDPQSNLSGMFMGEDALESLWKKKETIDKDIAPLFKGVGDITDEPHIKDIAPLFKEEGDITDEPHIKGINEKIGLLVGDLDLSKREDDLSTQWPKCLGGDERSFRVTTAFARLIASAGKEFGAELALVDVGPNLGAINRAALIASDYVVLPLAPDLFSLQGLHNVGPTLRDWRQEWKDRLDKKPEGLDIELPEGDMQPLGYIVMRHTTRLSRPVQAYMRWIEKIPREYGEAVMQRLGRDGDGSVLIDTDRNCLAQLKDYRSLMPLAQEVNKPMFMLKPGDGAIGAQQKAVGRCYEDFETLARKIIRRISEK